MTRFVLILAAFLVGCGNDEPPSDPRQAHDWHVSRAAKGDMDSQFALAEAYRRGVDQPRDYIKARNLYQQAAEQGHIEAMHELARLLIEGSFPNGPKQAVIWLTKLAENSRSDFQYTAQMNLAHIYLSQEYGLKNVDLAIQWSQKAAERSGSRDAKEFLANAYFQRVKGEAEKGNTNSMFELGRRYEVGDGVARDKTLAQTWRRRAAEGGSNAALTWLGDEQAKGDTFTEHQTALANWTKAAEKGHPEAMIRLAHAYRKGFGVPSDTRSSFEWAERAAILGNSEGQKIAGFLYESGEGTFQDSVLAYAWLNLAVLSRDTEAYQARDLIEARLPKAELTEAQELSSAWKVGSSISRKTKKR